MSPDEKFSALRQIRWEEKFRQHVLGPLLDKMGLQPVHTHGTTEHGKDIVCQEDNSFGITEWIAVVAKVGRITGNTSEPSGLSSVLNQIHEAFDYPFEDSATKRKQPINKVFVVTNDEILATAKGRIVERLGRPGANEANVHFIDGHKMALLIDEHWPTFWESTDQLLSEEERMTEDAGLVLYVLARAWVQSQVPTKKKVAPGLSPEKIAAQTGLPRKQVESALKYLLLAEYAEQRKKMIQLHSKKTVGHLLIKPDQIRVLIRTKNIADKHLRFSVESLIEDCKQQQALQFQKKFVLTTLKELSKKGSNYIKPDEARGAKHYVLDISTFNDERPYLECWLRYLGDLPRQPDRRKESSESKRTR